MSKPAWIPNAKVKNYLIDKKSHRTKNGRRKIDPNRIIPCFFLENGKPNFEFLPNCEQLVPMAHYSWPKNEDSQRIFKAHFQVGITFAITHLQKEWGA